MTTLVCTVLQKSLTKIFIIQSMMRQKIRQIKERISRRRLVYNPTIQYSLINLHTKYDNSSLHDFTEIFDEKIHYSNFGKKQNRTNTGKKKNKRLNQNPMIQYITINLHTKYDYSSMHSFTETSDENFHYSNYGKKENWINAVKNKHEKAGLNSYNTIHPAKKI